MDLRGTGVGRPGALSSPFVNDENRQLQAQASGGVGKHVERGLGLGREW